MKTMIFQNLGPDTDSSDEQKLPERSTNYARQVKKNINNSVIRLFFWTRQKIISISQCQTFSLDDKSDLERCSSVTDGPSLSQRM